MYMTVYEVYTVYISGEGYVNKKCKQHLAETTTDLMSVERSDMSLYGFGDTSSGDT